MVVQVLVAKNIVTMLDLGQLRVILSKGLKDIATRLLMDEVHEPKNALSEFMDLSDTNYKFMDLKMHFHSLWI